MFSPRRKGSVASALFNVRMTVCASGVAIDEMLSNTARLALLVDPSALARSKVHFTAVASKSVPSWNFTPLRSGRRSASATVESLVQLAASSGVTRPSTSILVRPWM